MIPNDGSRRIIRTIMVMVVGCTVAAAQIPYDSLYRTSSTYRYLTGQFALSKLESTDIVMLGNSITFGGNWNDLLGRERIVNRGIGGDNTLGMLHRLQYVYNLKPHLCFIMAGINDLYADEPVDLIFSNYVKIIDTLEQHKIVPIIQSTLYTNPKWKRSEEKNREVDRLNTLLKEYADTHDIEFVDVNTRLSADHMLRDEYTSDGVHLTPAAYEVWRDILLPVIVRRGF